MDALLEIEARRLSEQERLDSLKTALERNRLGQYATPPALALDIAQFARRQLQRSNSVLPIRFLDPSIGTGSFFSAVARTFLPQELRFAAGIELDTDFAKVVKQLWNKCGLHVINGDFTKLAPVNNLYDMIIANPPYVRHHHLPTEEKTRLRRLVLERLGIEVSGLAGLYVYFLLLADCWLSDTGLAIWLIPSEFMDVNYGDVIKRYLSERVQLLRIHRFCPNDVQFSDALVSSAIVVFRKNKSPREHRVVLSFGGKLSDPSQEDNVSLDSLRTERKWTKFLLNATRFGNGGVLTLSNVFNIKRGLATGANNYFILPRSEIDKLEIPAHFLRPILPSPRYVTDEVIESESGGFPAVRPQLALIDCSAPEVELRERYPRFWKYLEKGLEQGVDKGYLASRRSPWYSQEKRPPAPFVCTYMGRPDCSRKPFRFLWNKSEATAANVYLMLYPHGTLKAALNDEPSLYPKVFNTLRTITSEMFLGESRVYGGGLHKLEPCELGRISAEPIIETIRMGVPKQLSLFG